MSRRTLMIVVVPLVVLGSYLAGSWNAKRHSAEPTHQDGRRILHYHCPMHPQYTSDRPGDAPCCGMRLEPVYAGEATGAAPSSALAPSTVRISREMQQVIGIRIGAVDRRPVTHTIRLLGRVAPNENRTYVLNAAVDGWIRDVESFSTGSLVEKDQPLATFYSKDFVPAQQNYFSALTTLDRLQKSQFSTPEQITLTNVQVWSQEDALQNLGMGETQIKEIAANRQYVRDVVIRSPDKGFVLERNVSPAQRFQRGDLLYRIANLNQVWVLADLFQREARYFHPGQQLVVRYQDATFRGTVSDILPQFDGSSRTLKLRLEVNNPTHLLRPDMFVDVESQISLPAAITVAADAVLDSGRQQTVFVVRGEGEFEARKVETGWRLGDRVEVLRGLQEGERIVTAGNFLIDSESRMKSVGHQGSAPSPKEAKPAAGTHIDAVCGMEVDAAKAAGKSEHRGKTYYFCSDQCKRSFDKNPQQYVKTNAR